MIDDSQLIRGIYEAACDERPWGAQFQALQQGFDAQSTMIFTPQLPNSSRDHFCVQIGLQPEVIDAYLHESQEVDLWYHGIIRRYGLPRTGLVYATHALVEDRVLKKSRFFADYLRPLGVGYALGTVISSGADGDGVPLMTINIYRPFGRAHFTPRDVNRFAQFQTHLRRAMIVRTRLHAASLASMALDQTATPLIVLAVDRRILLANPAAEILLAGGSGSLLRHGRLQATSPQATADLDASLAACHRREFSPQTGAVIRLTGRVGAGLVVRVVPPPSGFPKGHLAAAVGILSREGTQPVEPSALMATLYRLTPAEALLVKALCAGSSPEEHSAARSVSMATVKTQMQSVFGKTGVRRQAELVRLAGTLAR